jgi:hypothetical protein
MKKLTIFSFALVAGMFLLTVNPANVQAQADEDEIKLYQTMYGMEKRNLINEAMSLTAENKDAFWAVYEEYETERRATGKERIAIIKEYIEVYGTATDEKLDGIAKAAFTNDARYQKLEVAYYEKMKKATSSATAFRWTQVERYLALAIRAAIADELPFMPDAK